MRIFISAGEPSGDLHGANLVRALKQLDPTLEFVGFGGDRMETAGCRLIYPLCRLAVMWFLRVLLNAHVFLSLLSKADRYFKKHRPDAVVLIDYPGFNWWIARRAHFHGIPVFYFVPPQIWAWAGWRIQKMQRWVDHVLCSLPFEEKWYTERGVRARFVGHPYFDELIDEQVDRDFMESQKEQGGTIIGLLPGSRTQEVERNLSTLVRAAIGIQEKRPDTRFLVACFRPSHQETIKSYVEARGLSFIETFVNRTPEIIRLAHSCIAVSGSVGLELLYQAKPSVIVYRIGRIDLKVCRFFIKSRYISLVNLLADKELFPEYLTDRCESGAVCNLVLRWLNNPAAYNQLCADVKGLRDQVAEPGACRRAAEYILDAIRVRNEIGTQQAA